MKPKVSFITGVKNYSSELKEMIQSLIDQDMPEWESIIVDDHSDEDLQAVIQSFHDDRLHYFKLPDDQNGICQARNLAIDKAQSEIMLTADGDDISLPSRARKTYEIMIQNNLDVFYCNLNDYLPEENKLLPRQFQPFNPKLLEMFNFVYNPGTAYKKSIFLKAGRFNPKFVLSEDYDLWLRVLKLGAKFGYTEEILVNYRRSAGSVSISKFSKMHQFIMDTRISNNVAPFDIQEVRKYARPEIAQAVLSEKGVELWQDDRFEAAKANQ